MRGICGDIPEGKAVRYLFAQLYDMVLMEGGSYQRLLSEAMEQMRKEQSQFGAILGNGRRASAVPITGADTRAANGANPDQHANCDDGNDDGDHLPTREQLQAQVIHSERANARAAAVAAISISHPPANPLRVTGQYLMPFSEQHL